MNRFDVLLLAASLLRVFIGFAGGSAVAIPLGTLMGSTPLFNRVISPLVQVLKPVSPLAWFPLGLATLKSEGEIFGGVIKKAGIQLN